MLRLKCLPQELVENKSIKTLAHLQIVLSLKQGISPQRSGNNLGQGQTAENNDMQFITLTYVSMAMQSPSWAPQHSANQVESSRLLDITRKKLPSIEVGPTVLSWRTTMINLDLQPPASYGHELLTCKSSSSTISRFQRQSGNKWMDRWTEAIALSATLIWSVINHAYDTI